MTDWNIAAGRCGSGNGIDTAHDDTPGQEVSERTIDFETALATIELHLI